MSFRRGLPNASGSTPTASAGVSQDSSAGRNFLVIDPRAEALVGKRGRGTELGLADAIECDLGVDTGTRQNHSPFARIANGCECHVACAERDEAANTRGRTEHVPFPVATLSRAAGNRREQTVKLGTPHYTSTNRDLDISQLF